MSDEGQAVKLNHVIAHAADPASAQDKRDAQAYRALMEDVDSSRYEANAASLDRLRHGMHTKLAESMFTYVPTDLDRDTADVLAKARNLITDAFDTAGAVGTKVTAHLRDPKIFPGAKRDYAEQEVTKAVSTIEQSTEAARILLDESERALYEAARPRVNAGEEMIAREDARLLLDTANNRGEIMQRIDRYVRQNDDSVSGLLTDPKWLSTYLTSRGFDPEVSEVYQGNIRAGVMQRASQSSDKKRKASADAINHVRSLRASIDVASSARNYIDPRKRT